MYPSAEGQFLSEEQARALDDTFLASNPYQYFTSRIMSLIDRYDRPTSGVSFAELGPTSLRGQFRNYLGWPDAKFEVSESDVAAQVAMDALSVRQHAAEALVRFCAVRLTPEASATAPCLWADMATGPTQMADVIRRLRERTNDPAAGESVFRALVPRERREMGRRDPELVEACNVFVAWLAYAVQILSPGEIDTQAAHNKVKHGLAVRSRPDMRVGLVMAPIPDGDTIPISAVRGPQSLDVFDRPVLEVLARPTLDGHRQGLEVSQLRLNPAALLAEAHMLAMTHGAFFHVAANDHFSGRSDLGQGCVPPAHPGYPVGGPLPEHIDADAALGMRFSLTQPLGGGSVTRTTGIAYRDRFVTLHIDHVQDRRMRIVDD
ncbi:hypothetical protein ACUN7V_00970 [Quadrisphaera oryzae]|uniref:hypothetical protein n=1 Tax=Quadrisphaera TaxID=317661 RepID=UPI0016447FDE|nr:hypothetical protein [Quadrisphaera sp. RL12-1S]MBC3762601.1 hypothetical protein [Quadrisphaera sp. RL12-1S]